MSAKITSQDILESIYKRALKAGEKTVLKDASIRERVDYVCRCISNRAGARLLMACLLGKLDNPKVDPRKPYTEIGTKDSFSGRTYDEGEISPFISKYHLPCNSTTAFLTPTLRNIDHSLTTTRELVGRPRELYIKTVQLLEDVAKNRIQADVLFVEIVRVLLKIRNEDAARRASLLEALRHTEGALPLSTEAIITLISQHLDCKHSSRLPVLIVAAAYIAVEQRLGERIVPLNSHNAADFQTGSIGDVEVCLIDDDAIVTAYEMKMKRVTIEDIDCAVSKIAKAAKRIHNYIFITTEKTDADVSEYAAKFYEETGGVEIVILDCISFLRYFLHLFHRLRVQFLNSYQKLVLEEPNSAVN